MLMYVDDAIVVGTDPTTILRSLENGIVKYKNNKLSPLEMYMCAKL